MQIYPLQLLLPRIEEIPSLREVCTKAKNDFRSYVDRGWYEETAESGIYIYRIESKGRKHTGILALNDVADYKNGLIKKHEKTLAAREAEYHLLLRDWRAVIKPILMTYPENPTITVWVNQYTEANAPDFQVGFSDENEQHTLWMVTDPAAIRYLQDLFSTEVPAVYIADGHHRTSTIANFSDRPEIEEEGLDFRRIFCAYFADDQLDILGYHRILRLEEPITPDEFMENLDQWFPLTPLKEPRLPGHKREIVILTAQQAWSLDFSVSAPTASHILDATLLNDLILSEIAGVLDVRADKRISYSEGAKGVDGVKGIIAGEPESLIGFLVFPVAFPDLFYISDQGDILPPKSTWFEPRIKSGLLVQSLDIR
jgi:uncharacterized protein (DUF1015 family)